MKGVSKLNSPLRVVVADAQKLGVGGYLVIGSLLALLIGAIVFAVLAWSLDTDVPAFGYAAMAAGAVFTLAVGVGLMALCFCSSRFGYDEPIKIIPSHDQEPPREDERRQ
jgi:hypothetical protein